MIKKKSSETFTLNNRHFEIAFLFLFLFSGFSALIYESVWTHYLKLIFGHAAYAQSLVLSIFMGGLAIGAYFASRLNPKIKNPLQTYAIIEILIGIFALFFHDVFIFSQNILFLQWAPNIDSSLIFTCIKWLFGILLILPQSILLGTTFPLISSGMLQLSPLTTGKNISLLYFNNSFGAAIGALVSGFILIQTFGLPGTILTAGLINIAIGLMAILLVKQTSMDFQPQKITQQPLIQNKFYYLMLCTAFFTGLASFFYEIAWIRMLTLLIGGTAHAFELMISAFILGLALGSLWIKKRIDQFKSPVITLGYIQLLMATFALLTLTFYDGLFDLMVYILNLTPRNNGGYILYTIASHTLALLVMLPATFFAGMTLPLITNILLKKNKNEKVVGHVYAVNTLGAVIGIVIAMNFLLPLTGTKGLVGLGVLVDFSIALIIFGYVFRKTATARHRYQFILACVFSLVTFQTLYHNSNFDPLKISAGVYRSGIAKHEEGTKNLFHKDGKLSTVDIIELPDGNTLLFNNGKADAGIKLYQSTGGEDEPTMILIAAIPIAINPEIKTAANIGMGSGQTVQTLLSYDFMSQVDSIEIEEAVIEALPAFKIYSQLPRYDKRSNIIIDDAKSFFSSSKTKYDLIISEPPNPWVSGIASLFTTEFYAQIKQKLTTKGLLSQWLHLYEINIDTVSSIIKALSQNFKHYALFNLDNDNIVIIASDHYDVSKIQEQFLNSTKVNLLLKRINIESSDSIRARYIGDKKLLDPLFFSYPSQAASDFYPLLPYQAGKSFFLRDNTSALTNLHHFPIPVNQILMGNFNDFSLNTANEKYFTKSKKITIAKSIVQEFRTHGEFKRSIYPQQLRYSLKLLSNQLFQCRKEKLDAVLIRETAYQLVTATTPYLGKNDLTKLWEMIQTSPCYKHIPAPTKAWISLHKEIATQNFSQALKFANIIFNKSRLTGSKELSEYLFAAMLISAITTNQLNLARSFWKSYSPLIFTNPKEVPLSLRLLLAHLNVVRKN